VLDGQKYTEYLPIVKELTKTHTAEEVIAALLRLNYDDSFNPQMYKEISEVKIDTTGKSRLFIAL
jgi:DEAD/DEAH box helicase domain protein